MLNLSKATGAEPVKYEKLRGGTFINVLPLEIEIDTDMVDSTEGATTWEYWQVFTTETNEERLNTLYEKAVKQAGGIVEAEVLSKLTVTTEAGNTFDANPQARADMADGILASETWAQTETVWRLADNTEKLIDIAELREAHALALSAYATTKEIGV